MSQKNAWEDRWQQYLLKEQVGGGADTVSVPDNIPNVRELSGEAVRSTPEEPEAPPPVSTDMSRSDRRTARRAAKDKFSSERADLAAELDPTGLGAHGEEGNRVDPYSLGSRIKGTLDPLGVFTGDAQDAARRFRQTQRRGARGNNDVVTLNQAMKDVGPRGGLFRNKEAEEFYSSVDPAATEYSIDQDTGRIAATHQARERTPQDYAGALATNFLASDQAGNLTEPERTALQNDPLSFIQDDATSARAADLGLSVPTAGMVDQPGVPLEGDALLAAQRGVAQSALEPESGGASDTAQAYFGQEDRGETPEGEFRSWVQDLPADLRTDVSSGYRSSTSGHWGDLNTSWQKPIGTRNIESVQQIYPWATEDMTVGQLYQGQQALQQRGESPWIGDSPGQRQALGYREVPIQEQQIRALVEQTFRRTNAVKFQVQKEFKQAQQIRRLVEEAYKQGKK